MPLPPSVPREELHLRRIELRGYRRQDGRYDIEARMVDTKTSELTLADGRLLPPATRCTTCGSGWSWTRTST